MLSAILYYIFILPISLLPYPLLYLLSDIIYFFIYYVFGYRKDVVLKNLRNSFPKKSEEEIKEICKKFFHHLCDLVVESLKNFTITEKQARKRFVTINPEIFDKYYNENRDIVLVGGHYNNWELFAVAMGFGVPHIPYGIYKPLSNKFFEKKMRSSRGKYRLVMVPMKETKKYFEAKTDKPKILIFGSDQWPSKAKQAYWTKFMGQDTATHYGAEKYAKDYNCVVMTGEIRKIKRGYYEAHYQLLTETPRETEYGGIIEMFTKSLESYIYKAPQYWLWSHKRWKRTKEEVFDEQ